MVCSQTENKGSVLQRNVAEYNSACSLNERRGCTIAVESESKIAASDRSHQVHGEHVGGVSMVHGDNRRWARTQIEHDHRTSLSCRDGHVRVFGLAISPCI